MISLSPSKISECPPISTGGFGLVFDYPSKNASQPLVVKKIICDDARNLPKFLSEVVLGFNHNSPLILPIYGFNLEKLPEDKNNPKEQWAIYIKMPKMLRSLKDHIDKETTKSFSKAEAVKCFYRLSYGLNQLKHLKIAHRDIKPGNILLDDDNNVVLADLGLSSLVSDLTEEPDTFVKGTPRYYPPEYHDKARIKKKNLFKCDAWSLGLTMLEVCLFKESDASSLFKEKNTQKAINIVSQRYGPEFSRIIAGLLAPLPDDRITTDQVCEQLENHFSEYLEDTFELLATNIRTSHRKIVIEKTLEHSEEFQDRIVKKALREGFELGKYHENFYFDLGKELAMRPKDPLQINNQMFKELKEGLSELINESSMLGSQGLSLDFSWCKNLEEEFVKPFTLSTEKAKEIKNLDLKFTACSNMNDAMLSILSTGYFKAFSNVQNLSLDLSGCQNITSQGIINLVESMNGLSLTKFKLDCSECENLDFGEGIEIFVEEMQKQRILSEITLDFTGCLKILQSSKRYIKSSLNSFRRNVKVI